MDGEKNVRRFVNWKLDVRASDVLYVINWNEMLNNYVTYSRRKRLIKFVGLNLKKEAGRSDGARTKMYTNEYELMTCMIRKCHINYVENGKIYFISTEISNFTSPYFEIENMTFGMISFRDRLHAFFYLMCFASNSFLGLFFDFGFYDTHKCLWNIHSTYFHTNDTTTKHFNICLTIFSSSTFLYCQLQNFIMTTRKQKTGNGKANLIK